MFTTLIVQPIFNLLVFIYAMIPGHNFGLAIILFTIVIRILMWPLIKKQLHQVKLMRKIQPELKKIKKAAAGDKRKESLLMMELYKERGISPFGQIGIILLQIPILLGLYIGLQRVLKDPHELVSFAYPFLQDLSWLKELGSNIHLFDATLFNIVDLTRPALSSSNVYWPAFLIVTASAVAQFFQAKQLSPTDKDARGLRAILRDAKSGKQADQAEVNAAMARSTRYLLPALVFIFTIHLPSALSLYWLVSGLVAFIQQSIILREDTNEMEESVSDEKEKKGKAKTASKSREAADREKKAVEAEIVDKPTKKKPGKKTAARKKRRK
jgi:YidC/Oxa1 family membrane protein insertase